MPFAKGLKINKQTPVVSQAYSNPIRRDLSIFVPTPNDIGHTFIHIGPETESFTPAAFYTVVNEPIVYHDFGGSEIALVAKTPEMVKAVNEAVESETESYNLDNGFVVFAASTYVDGSMLDTIKVKYNDTISRWMLYFEAFGGGEYWFDPEGYADRNIPKAIGAFNPVFKYAFRTENSYVPKNSCDTLEDLNLTKLEGLQINECCSFGEFIRRVRNHVGERSELSLFVKTLGNTVVDRVLCVRINTDSLNEFSASKFILRSSSFIGTDPTDEYIGFTEKELDVWNDFEFNSITGYYEYVLPIYTRDSDNVHIILEYKESGVFIDEFIEEHRFRPDDTSVYPEDSIFVELSDEYTTGSIGASTWRPCISDGSPREVSITTRASKYVGIIFPDYDYFDPDDSGPITKYKIYQDSFDVTDSFDISQTTSPSTGCTWIECGLKAPIADVSSMVFTIKKNPIEREVGHFQHSETYTRDELLAHPIPYWLMMSEDINTILLPDDIITCADNNEKYIIPADATYNTRTGYFRLIEE